MWGTTSTDSDPYYRNSASLADLGRHGPRTAGGRERLGLEVWGLGSLGNLGFRV